jgi:DNA-binding transcriptional MerR regulator
MAQYSIKDIETLSGVKAHTLRMWEQRYDFLKPQRTDTNIRHYDDEQLKLILNISTLNRHGVKISKIACMCQEELCREVLKLSEGTGEASVALDALIHAMIDLDEARFEKTLSCAIMKHGIEKAFTHLVFPLMDRAGVLWSTGVIKPVQEHFMSNLIRRKICAAIDGLYVHKNANSRRFVLFLPEGESHELVLLFTEYVLRQRNHEVAYLGNSVPINDIEFIAKSFRPDYLVTYITLPFQDISLQEYLDKLSISFPSLNILVGGKQLNLQAIKLPANTRSINSMEQLCAAIAG